MHKYYFSIIMHNYHNFIRKIRALNAHVQMYGPMNVLEDVVDGYLEICRAILIIIGKQIYGCAC